MKLRAQRRDRAAQRGPELFLFDRVFEDCLERLALVPRTFERALLIGCPNPQWPDRLRAIVPNVDVVDPGPLFAAAAAGQFAGEEEWKPRRADYDLVLAIGTLDTVNDLAGALRSLFQVMRTNSLFLGAMSGGHTLPVLRQAMRAADEAVGAASPHVHPRVEAAAVAPLLASAGFVMPVVDVDRIDVSYRSLDSLVADLRAMGATNILSGRARRPISRGAWTAAARAFAAAGQDGRTTETFEVLHFAAWTPASRRQG